MAQLVEMTFLDLITVFAMRNDPIVLASSISQSPVSWPEHEAFFKHAKYPKYVYKLEDGMIIGYVDFRPYPKSEDVRVAEWGFHIAPWARGLGHAFNMLTEALNQSRANFDTVIGRVLPSNEKSIKLHGKLGFRHTTTDHMLQFELSPL